MTEQKVKKRAWVKDAAIIFLTVMLVLTFFSNTIMNHSLPEVAAEYVQSGSINAKIRGTGTVTANESYEVKSEQIREVLSVPVQVGDKVEVGDILILFGDAESTQIKEAQNALDELVLAYKKALITSSADGDYSKEKRAIELAQKALDKAKVEREANVVTAQQLADAKAAVNRAKSEVATQQAKIDGLQDKFDGMSPPKDNTQTMVAIQKKKSEINAAEKSIDSTQKAYPGAYEKLKTDAQNWKDYANDTQKDLSFYISLLGERLKSELDKIDEKKLSEKPQIDLPYGKVDYSNAVEMVELYDAIKVYQDKISALQSEIQTLEGQMSYGDWNYDDVKKQLADAKTQLISLQTLQTNFENTLKELEAKKEKFDTADKNVDTNQTALEDAMFALAQKQKEEGKAQATGALDLEAQRDKIEKKKEEISELKAGGDGASVESKVNGTVSAINVSAGKTSQPDTPLMVIEVPDMGYGISFPVTAEQSKKVKVGDQAEIMYYYSSDSVSATLVGIKTDPQNPGKSKLLCFKLQGEVETGTQLTVSIGERGGNYETIVPNSAVRSDNNGSFVLAVMAKSSPLGNRFVAQRIDVKVLASDDVKSAVSGALTNSDMVITTSNKPVESGALVRMPD
ncbi:MAG: HlyD family efflux transporter periplasmic adaptor subunit [Oscillospiraceae bacterium]|jgi:multidrug efflux pump subunit AcrA (membrane-fusion protein)